MKFVILSGNSIPKIAPSLLPIVTAPSTIVPTESPNALTIDAKIILAPDSIGVNASNTVAEKSKNLAVKLSSASLTLSKF